MIGQSDEVLMKMVQDGDLDKSAVLFERYQIKVYNYFVRLTLNKEASMDLSQNTFYRMLHYRSTYNSDKSFKSWLFGIARNVFFDNTKDKHAKTNSLESLNFNQHIEKNSVLKLFENEALYNALAALSNDERDLIEMSRFQNIKYEEIAEIQGLSLSAVKVKIHRAIKKLRTHYFKDDLRTKLEIKAN